jgi:hypothetical protein
MKSNGMAFYANFYVGIGLCRTSFLAAESSDAIAEALSNAS